MDARRPARLRAWSPPGHSAWRGCSARDRSFRDQRADGSVLGLEELAQCDGAFGVARQRELHRMAGQLEALGRDDEAREVAEWLRDRLQVRRQVLVAEELEDVLRRCRRHPGDVRGLLKVGHAVSFAGSGCSSVVGGALVGPARASAAAPNNAARAAAKSSGPARSSGAILGGSVSLRRLRRGGIDGVGGANLDATGPRGRAASSSDMPTSRRKLRSAKIAPVSHCSERSRLASAAAIAIPLRACRSRWPRFYYASAGAS